MIKEIPLEAMETIGVGSYLWFLWHKATPVILNSPWGLVPGWNTYFVQRCVWYSSPSYFSKKKKLNKPLHLRQSWKSKRFQVKIYKSKQNKGGGIIKNRRIEILTSKAINYVFYFLKGVKCNTELMVCHASSVHGICKTSRDAVFPP